MTKILGVAALAGCPASLLAPVPPNRRAARFGALVKLAESARDPPTILLDVGSRPYRSLAWNEGMRALYIPFEGIVKGSPLRN